MPTPVQDTFANDFARGFPGMVANGETSNRISRTLEEGEDPLPFGAPAFRGTTDHTCIAVAPLTAASAAFGTNTGNGVMGAITVSEEARPGRYILRIVEEVANAGNFVIEDPDGEQIGDGAVAAAFDTGGLAFTLADGATDFGVGDAFAITVGGGGLLGIAIADHGVVMLPGGVADTFPEFYTVPIMERGVIWVTAGDDIAAGDEVAWEPVTGTYVATGAADVVPLPGWKADTSGADGDLIRITNNRP